MNRRKIRIWIPGLMIASQMLLLLFVCYWLNTQYNSALLNLQKELSRSFITTQDQLVDSMVFQHLVKPFKHDSTLVIVNVKHNIDNIDELNFSHEFDSLFQTSGDSIKKNQFISISISDSNETIGQHKPIIIESERNNQVLTRSVKLFVNNTEEQLNKLGSTTNRFPFPIDTLLFKKVFNQKLLSEGLNFEVIWMMDSLSDSLNQGPFTFKSNMDANLPMVQINRYKTHVLSLIFPQIAFAIFLLLLTGSAFFISYRSIVQQHKLGEIREAFIGNITHELKTPVSTMKVALEAIKKYGEPGESSSTKEYIQMATTEANRLDQLINHILNHSKLESQKQVLNLKQVSIKTLIITVMESMKLPAEQKQATITFIEPQSELFLHIDAIYIESVLRNLIDNSLKYCNTKPVVKLSALAENNKIKIQVSDNGPGIPNEYLSQVFEKFFRVPQGNIHNIKGYGLGLSFARLIMKLHGGEIYVKNLHEGCVFELQFPIKQ